MRPLYGHAWRRATPDVAERVPANRVALGVREDQTARPSAMARNVLRQLVEDELRDSYRSQAGLGLHWSELRRGVRECHHLPIDTDSATQPVHPVRGEAERLAGAQDMDGTLTALAENYVLVNGDIRSAYTIVDRLGLEIVYDSMVLGTNRRPTGQAGFVGYFRTGAKTINVAAARVLNVT